MENKALNSKKKILTNSILIALYLILALHFSAPHLLNFFAFSIKTFRISYLTLLMLITPSLTEMNPCILIFDLIPNFLFGFDVETALGSKKYALSLLLSACFTNLLTFGTVFILNHFSNFLRPDYFFASAAPLVLFCLTTFGLFFNSPIGKFSNMATFGIMFLFLIHIVYGIFSHIIQIINLIYSIFVNFAILKWIDPSLSFKDYFNIFIPSFANKYVIIQNGENTNQENNSILDEKDEIKNVF